jgi:hypothetical protein
LLHFILHRSRKDFIMPQPKAASTPQHRQPEKRDAAAHCPSRRTFLAVAAGTAIAAFASTPMSWLPRAQAAEGTATAASAAFLRVSMFVTGQRDLDQETSKRFLAALSRRDAGFATRIDALLAHVDQAKFADMDAFLAATPADAALLATATSVVSAWYLGIVGDAADAELITYADALMYRPTRGILAVPTYGPGPLAWGAKPQSS